MQEPHHLSFIRQTYDLAYQSAQNGFDPFAAILVKDNEVVFSSMDRCILDIDPTAHAEVAVIRGYCQAHRVISLEGFTLYANVEPCIMCSGAIHWARLSTLVFGVSQKRLQEVSGGHPKPSCHDLINIGKERTQVIGPILEEEGMAILKAFPFQSKKKRLEEHLKNKDS